MTQTVAAPPTQDTGTCAVIMAAYRATKWIGEALESIRSQEAREGWTYSLRIGVDGCEDTSAFLLAEGEPHWFSPENVGPYVIRNSLIELEPASAYAIFDADDVMQPDYLTTLLKWMRGGIAGGARFHVDETGEPISERISYRSGVALFSHEAWTQVGGYRAWPIAADHDLICRAKALGIQVTRPKKPIYHRRIHDDSLTQDPETGFGTNARKHYKAEAHRLTRSAMLHVKPVTTPLEHRTP